MINQLKAAKTGTSTTRKTQLSNM